MTDALNHSLQLTVNELVEAKALVTELMDLTNTAHHATTAMMSLFNPDVYAEMGLTPDVVATVLDAMAPCMMQAAMPVYLKMFTPAELRAACEFYRSPAGHAFAVAAPALMVSVANAMQIEWAPELERRLRAASILGEP